MTLNAKIKVFMDFRRFRAARHISRANCAENDWDKHGKLRIKFSALNVNFDGLSLDFLGSRKPAHEGIKERYFRKSCYFAVVGQFFAKTVAARHGHAAYHNKH